MSTFYYIDKTFTFHISLFCYLPGDDHVKELDDDYYNEITRRKHVKVVE